MGRNIEFEWDFQLSIRDFEYGMRMKKIKKKSKFNSTFGQFVGKDHKIFFLIFLTNMIKNFVVCQMSMKPHREELILQVNILVIRFGMSFFRSHIQILLFFFT